MLLPAGDDEKLESNSDFIVLFEDFDDERKCFFHLIWVIGAELFLQIISMF
jgi:hypothetical protein